MSTTLYRKYRPQTFAEIVNQDHIKKTIQQEIATGKLPHAFLFCGPRGTGKTTTARVIAKALNCAKRKERESEPCNDCPSCEAINSSSSLSLVEVDAASQTGVDNVRDNIIANARVAVKSNEFKIFIIDEVHMLSTSSFNALLKTLEEPPARVVFILATTELHKIPETILSRCQRFDFHPVKAALLVPYLGEIAKKEKRQVEEAVIEGIVKKSGGYVRDAMSLLGQVLTLPGKVTAEAAAFILPVPHKEHVLALFDLVSQQKTGEALQYLQTLDQQGVRIQPFCQELIEFMHDVLLASSGVPIEGMEAAAAIIKRYTPVSCLRALDVLMRRHQQLKSYDQGMIPLELAIIELSEPMTAAPTPVIVAAAPTAVAPARPAPSVVQASPTQQPAKPATPATPAAPAVPKRMSAKPVAKKEEPIAPTGKGPSATYDDVQPLWSAIMRDVSEAQHSLFIVLRSSTFRVGKSGEPELAFRYRMHHDLAKRSIVVLNETAAKHLPNKAIRFTVSIDENLDTAMPGDVEEPKSSETAALGAELSRLAEAFGGTVIE